MGRGGDAAGTAGQKVYSAEEVAKHNKAGDSWLVFRGKVLDVSKWKDHPGGSVIFSQAGQDCTDVFTAFHGSGAYEQMERFAIGTVAGMAPPSPFEADMRALHAKFVSMGLFKTSATWYTIKFLSTSALMIPAWLLVMYTTGFWGKMAGAIALGWFWQQCGWLAHDFLHHAVVKSNRTVNDCFGLLVGNIYLGFSVDWWKNKHNTHHSIPNTHETALDAHDGDPDIDTLPLLAWSRRLAAKAAAASRSEANSPFARTMVKYQALTYIPILMFARLTWALQSVVFAYHMSRWGGYFAASSPAAIAAAKAAKAGGKSATAAAAASAAVSAAEAAEGGYTLRYEVLEKVCLLVHYAWYLTLAFAWNDVWTGLAFILVSQTWSGILIALAFGVGHNGMMIYDMEKKPGFSELQVTTTRNVHDGPFIGWFMGGLHYQIEHHLYPTMPRHNLKVARTFVEPLCKKHGVPYRCTGLWEGTVEVLRHLDDVSHALAEFPAI